MDWRDCLTLLPEFLCHKLSWLVLVPGQLLHVKPTQRLADASLQTLTLGCHDADAVLGVVDPLIAAMRNHRTAST